MSEKYNFVKYEKFDKNAKDETNSHRKKKKVYCSASKTGRLLGILSSYRVQLHSDIFAKVVLWLAVRGPSGSDLLWHPLLQTVPKLGNPQRFSQHVQEPP